MTESIKNFPKFLLDNGLIYEINRRILHPLGLAMVVDIDYHNKRKLAITALIETEDEVGFLYDEDSFGVGKEKYEKYINKVGDRLDARRIKYGFLEQDKVIDD